MNVIFQIFYGRIFLQERIATIKKYERGVICSRCMILYIATVQNLSSCAEAYHNSCYVSAQKFFSLLHLVSQKIFGKKAQTNSICFMTISVES